MIETARFWLSFSLVLAAGCYRAPSFERCEVACSDGDQCPEGAGCLSDGFCHAGGDEAADCSAIDAGIDGGGQTGLAVAVGAEHTCAILGDGRLVCWGRNQRGQLGAGSAVRTGTPQILGSESWTTLAAGGAHACAVAASDGALWCWGANSLGQGGNGDAADHPIPVEVETTLTGWSGVSAGNVHTCAIDDGLLWCWGGNGYDQLGLASDDDPVLEPRQVGGEANWEVVSAGHFHTCGIRDAGRLFCWGPNTDGRLGVGDSNPRDVPAEVDPTGMRWRTVAAGGSHTCGIRVDGSLWCWGYSGSGQTGGGSSDVPAMVDAGPWRDVASGYTHSCGVTEDDELWCWGEDSRGQRGDGLGGGDGALVEIGTFATWASVAPGVADHACARTTSGDLHCWGDSGDGQIGDGELVDEHAPQQVPGGAGWTVIAAGGDRSCGIRSGSLMCWGGDFSRQAEIATSPTVIAAGTSWLAVAAGSQHGCAIDGDRNVWCWGDGTAGELGNGSTIYIANPVEIEPTREWLDITVGQDHTCAVEQITGGATAGPVSCWGANFDAQIRDPAMSGSATPVVTLAPEDFDEVSAGMSHTCAHRNGDNELHCWGSNSDLQTSGGLNPQWPPVPVPNAGWSAVGVGLFHSCGVLVGNIWCWGDDDSYQLGRGDAGGGADTATPVQAAGSTGNWDAVAGGRDHTCAIDRAAPAPGDLWCWGANSQGQLGLPRVDSAVNPTEIGVGTDWRVVAAGALHTCAIDGGGGLWCWGDNNLGQLGDGQSNRYAPTPVAPAVEP